MLPTLSQLGITSPSDVARCCPYTRPIKCASNSETQNPAEIQMPPSGESQMSPLDKIQMSHPNESQRPPSEEGYEDARADDLTT